MKVYHKRRNRWVKHLEVNKHLTFASPVGDAILLCKQAFAREYGIPIDNVQVGLDNGVLHTYASALNETMRKVWRIYPIPPNSLLVPRWEQGQLC